MPVQPLKRARTPSIGRVVQAFWYFAWASSSVSATTTVSRMTTLTSRGSRPASATAWRILATLRLAPSTEVLWMKTASACLPPNAMPLDDEPAWNSTGVRCGEGSHRWKPGTVKYSPEWSIGCTLAGST